MEALIAVQIKWSSIDVRVHQPAELPMSFFGYKKLANFSRGRSASSARIVPFAG